MEEIDAMMETGEVISAGASQDEEQQVIRRASSRKVIRRSKKEQIVDENVNNSSTPTESGQTVGGADDDTGERQENHDASDEPNEAVKPDPRLGSLESAPPGDEGKASTMEVTEPPLDEISQVDDTRDREASNTSDDMSDIEDKNDQGEVRERQMTLRAIEEELESMTNISSGEDHVHIWPQSYTIEKELGPHELPTNLDTVGPEIEQWLRENKKLSIRAVTWNLCARAPPSVEETGANLLPKNKYHIYVIGTEECERSIAQSALNPSKKMWEKYLSEVLGENYMPIKAHTLQAIHIMVFVHKSIAHLCSEVTSGAVATGVADTLGNKGGVIVSMLVGKTRFALVNVHLAAHQNKTERRNTEFARINCEAPGVIDKKCVKQGFRAVTKNRPSKVSSEAVAPSSNEDQPAPGASSTNDAQQHNVAVIEIKNDQQEPEASSDGWSSSSPTLRNFADRVVFMGDMNYRVRGTRKVVDRLLAHNMHDVMLSNDQLYWSMEQKLIPAEFVEPPLNFRPTYKFDLNSDVYDTGGKGRIPAWCDRILYIQDGLKCVTYDADVSLRTSDHRPVFATFLSDIELEEVSHEETSDEKISKEIPEFSSESQVCTIM